MTTVPDQTATTEGPSAGDEQYRPGDRRRVVLARVDLATLLEQIADELRRAPRSATGTPRLVRDTQETLAHAEALLAATGRKLAGMRRAALVTGRLAAARQRVLGDAPELPYETLRELYVDQLLSCKEIGARYGKSPEDIATVLDGAGIAIRPGCRSKTPTASNP